MDIMAVVSIDDRGRLTVPKEIGFRGSRVVIIPAGSFFITIPLPRTPLETAGNWLDSNRKTNDLKEIGDKAAMDDAVERAKRRKQA